MRQSYGVNNGRQSQQGRQGYQDGGNYGSGNFGQQPSNHDGQISYDIIEHLGTVCTNERTGWAIEINLISWNVYPPKYDIRPWAPDHGKMGKGISLRKEELAALRDIFNTMKLEE